MANPSTLRPTQAAAEQAPIRWPFHTTGTAACWRTSSTPSSKTASRASAAPKASRFTASSTSCCKLADQAVDDGRGLELREMSDAWNDFDAHVLECLPQKVEVRRALSGFQHRALEIRIARRALDRKHRHLDRRQRRVHARGVPPRHAGPKHRTEARALPYGARDDRVGERGRLEEHLAEQRFGERRVAGFLHGGAR